MLIIPKAMSEEAARECVRDCDADFDRRLATLAADIAAAGKDTGSTIKLIALSGPSCSGKTTAARKLSEDLLLSGRRVHTVSIDDFYLDREVLTERSKDRGVKLDLDSPDTIDIDALAQSVREIFDDNDPSVELPVFDFTVGKRKGTRSVPVDESDVFIFEGIQALYPNVASLLMKYPSVSIFICASQGLTVGDVTFSANEIRLMRRLVRDYSGRDASPQYTLMLWETVRENEDVHIFPYAHAAGYTINSTMRYEAGMLKPYLERILPEVKPGDAHYDIVADILHKLEGITPISTEYLSPDSLYHEFV